jgi:Ser/Thr protein kinase RdoA (MazF antagonist)
LLFSTFNTSDSGDVNQRQLASEVEWLDAIRRDTDLLVPKPVPNRSGEAITHLGDRLCVVFEWLEGEPVSPIVSPKIASEIGKIMAILHRHAENYRPQNYQEPRFDPDYYFGTNSWWQTKAEQRLSGADYRCLIPAVEKTKVLLDRLGTSPKHFGMSHTDIHFDNIIHAGETFAILDFGDCGLSYYLTDIAVTEAEFRDYPNADGLIRSFREAYEDTRGYFPEDEEIELGAVTAGLLYLEWVFETENDEVREAKAGWLPLVILDMQRSIIT